MNRIAKALIELIRQAASHKNKQTHVSYTYIYIKRNVSCYIRRMIYCIQHMYAGAGAYVYII